MMPLSTTLDALTRAYTRIATPDHWTTGTTARTAHGVSVSVQDDRATQFCAVGALYAGWGWMDPLDPRALDGSLRALDAAALPFTPETINDTAGHAAVLALYCAAIAATAFPFALPRTVG